MVFTDIVLLTPDVCRLSDFYESVFRIEIERNAVHTQFVVGGATITLYSTKAAVEEMGFDFTTFNGTGRTVICFQIDDIWPEVTHLKEIGVQFATEPKRYRWGADAAHFYDPDGNLVCFRAYPNR